MLTIRMQRTGRKGHAQFRVIVQDSRFTPTSGNVVAQLGHYDPHTKESKLDSEKAAFYLDHGAQPSDRVARLLKAQGVKLPKWVSLAEEGSRSTRNPDKLRKNRPPEPKAEPVAETPVEAPAEETPVETSAEDVQVKSEAAVGPAAEDAVEEPVTKEVTEVSDAPAEAEPESESKA